MCLECVYLLICDVILFVFNGVVPFEAVELLLIASHIFWWNILEIIDYNKINLNGAKFQILNLNTTQILSERKTFRSSSFMSSPFTTSKIWIPFSMCFYSFFMNLFRSLQFLCLLFHFVCYIFLMLSPYVWRQSLQNPRIY